MTLRLVQVVYRKDDIVEIYGPESSGKTTVALHMVAEVQKRGGIAGFIDAEHCAGSGSHEKYWCGCG